MPFALEEASVIWSRPVTLETPANGRSFVKQNLLIGQLDRQAELQAFRDSISTHLRRWERIVNPRPAPQPSSAT